jgi:glycosyltransferase involved in cell wall biosynthesis
MEAADALESLAVRLEQRGAGAWGGESSAPAALRALDLERDRIVTFVGKLLVAKGIDLLLAAWPLVIQSVPEARLCVVGFGTYRGGVERLISGLRAGELGILRDVAALGRELEGGPPGPLRHLAAFLDALEADEARLAAYLSAAPTAASRVHLTGRLEHDDLPDVLGASEAQVVPSTFPEAFGMVAAEAAACGALPVTAAHSGLAEVSAMLAPALEEPLRPLLSFEVGPRAVQDLGDRLVTWLRLDDDRRARAATALAELARARYGWEQVAEGVVDAAQGRLEHLPEPAPVRAQRVPTTS